MWSHARVDLGLTTEEFYRLTPRQLDALTKRHSERLQSNEFLFGQLASLIVNFSMCHPEKPTKISDFMPSMAGKDRERGKPKRRPRKVIDDEVSSFFDALAKRPRG